MPRSSRRPKNALNSRQMLFAVGGPPSPKSIFLVHIVTDILRRVFGAVTNSPCNTMEQREEHRAPPGPHVLFFDVPEHAVSAYLHAAAYPRLLVLDDFRSTVLFSMAARNMPLVDAVRFVSQSFCSLEPLVADKGVLQVEMPGNMSVADCLDLVARLLGFEPLAWEPARSQMHQDYAHFSQVGDAILGLIQFAKEAGQIASRLDASDLVTLDRLSKAYDPDYEGDVFWPAEILLSGTPPYKPISGTIELVGPARSITFGPYMHLATGCWAATYSFLATDDGPGNIYLFDLIADGEIKFSTQGLITANGKYAVHCEFEVRDALHPVEFRCFIAEGAISGQLKPLGVSFRRIPAVGSSRARPLATKGHL